jgi:hypothetical protein
MDKGGEPISSYFSRLLAWEPTPTEEAAAQAVEAVDPEFVEPPVVLTTLGTSVEVVESISEVLDAPPPPLAPTAVDMADETEAILSAAGVTDAEEPALQEEPWLAPPATAAVVQEDLAVVPIEALAPEEPALVGAAQDANVVPIASLAPDAVPIESLAPDAEPSEGGSPIRF